MDSTPDDNPTLASLQPVDDLRRALRREVSTLTGWMFVCLFFGSIAAVGALYGMYTDVRYALSGLTTTGRVRWVDPHTRGDNLQYSFKTASDQNVIGCVKAPCSLCRRLRKGDEIAVEYLRHSPTTNRVARLGWLDHVWNGSPAVPLLACACVAAYLRRRRSRRLDALVLLLTQGALTDGTIVKKQERRRKRRKWYVFTYRFEGPAGREFEGKETVHDLAIAEQLEEGQRITVAFLADDPENNIHLSAQRLQYYEDSEIRQALEQWIIRQDSAEPETEPNAPVR